jgi:hypothetical protein
MAFVCAESAKADTVSVMLTDVSSGIQDNFHTNQSSWIRPLAALEVARTTYDSKSVSKDSSHYCFHGPGRRAPAAMASSNARGQNREACLDLPLCLHRRPSSGRNLDWRELHDRPSNHHFCSSLLGSPEARRQGQSHYRKECVHRSALRHPAQREDWRRSGHQGGYRCQSECPAPHALGITFGRSFGRGYGSFDGRTQLPRICTGDALADQTENVDRMSQLMSSFSAQILHFKYTNERGIPRFSCLLSLQRSLRGRMSSSKCVGFAAS